MSRPSWDSTWCAVARTWAERSTCPRAATGAVLITLDNQQLTSGYNGAPRGLAHCADVSCLMEGGHCIRAMHAEANALMQAARLGISVDGATCYSTHRPCQRCTALLIQAGVRRVRYIEPYSSDDAEVAQAMAERAGLDWGVVVP